MARFLFASIPVPAHTSNPLPIAARLVERGHDVVWYAGAAFHDRIKATGARPVPYRDAMDFSGGDIFDFFPQYAGRDGVRVIGEVFAEIFVGHAPQRIADLRRVLADHPADAMLCDALMYGVGMLSELGGPPWATFGDGPLGFPEPDTPPFGPGLLPMAGPAGRLRNRVVSAAAGRLIFRSGQRAYDRIRADLGLPAGGDVLDALSSPYLHLQASTPGFEYPRKALPPHVHWIGALRPDPEPWVRPTWWPEVVSASRPVIHVTQGSLRADMTELVVPALRALAGEDVVVVVTSGAASAADVEAAYGGPLPANARVTPYVPYDELLPLAAVFVTNGGWSGLTTALHHGVPIVQAGSTEEKAENGARVQWSGVGLRLGTTRPSPDAVGRAVRRVLHEPSFAAAAARVRDEMVAHDAARESATLLEELARTRRTVTTGPASAERGIRNSSRLD
jgi:UDP:flavonoid glycosyltransferase YjiC (YdhE family)